MIHNARDTENDGASGEVAKFGETFEWHSHADEDEAFLVLHGRITIDFGDGTVELGDGDFDEYTGAARSACPGWDDRRNELS